MGTQRSGRPARRWRRSPLRALVAGGVLALAVAPAATRADAAWRAAIDRGDLAALAAMTPSQSELDEGGARGKTALMLAASRGDAALLARLLEGGAEVNRRNAAGGTALMYAAQYGHAGLARALLDAGASPDLTAAKGWTALMIAALKGQAPVVALLLGRGADPNVQDMHGWTPLMRALEAGQGAVARDLIAAPGVRLDVAAASGLTALHVAALRGHGESVSVLLERGADPTARDDAGNTALDLAERREHAGAAQVLRAAIAKR